MCRCCSAASAIVVETAGDRTVWEGALRPFRLELIDQSTDVAEGDLHGSLAEISARARLPKMSSHVLPATGQLVRADLISETQVAFAPLLCSRSLTVDRWGGWLLR